ncbi:MAG TPA: sigma 54-interacting transcriptional regulator [Kofleriaceae bacterium]|nr:sigma 54-interacting transcriptional regulator [Kofleriaceae bacterium]
MVDESGLVLTAEVEEDESTFAMRAEDAEYVFQRFCCRVVAGPDTGKCRQADGSELTIGTAAGTDLELSDPTVSRHHCSIRVADLGFHLRDLGSTNGTFVGAMRVDSGYLENGAILRLGSSRIRFEVLDETVHEPIATASSFGPVIGRSPSMRRLFSLLPKIAATDSTVLIEGATGSGKGLVAEAVHQSSTRAGKPFVVVDCGAIPPSLIESELFGHERGSFTGAHQTRTGAFESAQGGTVFIDEIGELELACQPKLLRVLEKRVVTRVGSTTTIPLDVRVIAATNRDLRTEVNEGRFRADLFYRLNILRVRLPSLSERTDDIPLLVAHFYQELTHDPDAIPPPSLVARLGRQTWGGNVRELRSAVERALLLGDPSPSNHTPMPDPTGARPEVPGSYRATKAQALASWESAYVADLIHRFEGNLSRAARAVKMDRNHLRALLHRYGINYAGNRAS